MVRSLKEKAQVAEKIASGDLTVEIAPHSEKDVLGNAFSAMVAKLRSHMNGLLEGFTVLSSAGSEILTATTQVVSSTAETAIAISQTTTTVEEVRQAARLSSEKAKNVSSNAQQVTQVSQSGQKAVAETASVILHIRDQMETIAQTIVRLSEQSQSIGGIIASVTDLADQSNLLAVNAAIEAARAGEQGKGFTVISLEIKNLAEQSKQATAQVRGILSEVQKATGAAVMATEQGSKAVEAGVKQSAQAGDAILILTEGSVEAAQSATQIVASSQQQVIGMDQIGIAMESINQAGAQTATSMRQVETAAQNLHELSLRLKGLAEQYKT
jgi:methyl-accepting chemotaxis protein